MPNEESPVIFFPDNAERRNQLQEKLKEYENRAKHYRSQIHVDSVYKIEVLNCLLKDGQVKTWDLARDMAKKYPDFDVEVFNKACAVIEDYCKTGGKNTHGGTGLPTPKPS